MIIVESNSIDSSEEKVDCSKTVTYKKENFASIGEASFDLPVCNVSGELCSGAIYPKIEGVSDGNENWTVYVRSEDKLESGGTSELSVKLDSRLPDLKGFEWKEPNELWRPDIDWNASEDLEREIQIAYKQQDKWLALKACGDGNFPCLENESEGSVKLIKNVANYQFKVTATKKTIPAITVQSIIEVNKDETGPNIKLGDPQVNSGQESYVVGKEFKINIASITDASGIESVGVYQGNSLIKNVTTEDFSKPFSVEISTSESNNITLGDDKLATLTIKATDKSAQTTSKAFLPLYLIEKGHLFLSKIIM